MFRTFLRTLPVALLATTLGGCFLFGEKPASPALPTAAPRQCERLLTKVPDPGAREGQEQMEIAGGYRAAFLKANKRIGAGRACEQKQADEIDAGAKK